MSGFGQALSLFESVYSVVVNSISMGAPTSNRRVLVPPEVAEYASTKCFGPDFLSTRKSRPSL